MDHELEATRARLVDRRSDCWARLEDAICELIAQHGVPGPELLALVQAMYERERPEAGSAHRGVPLRAPI